MSLRVWRHQKMAADCHPPLRLFWPVAAFGRRPLKFPAPRGWAATLERPWSRRVGRSRSGLGRASPAQDGSAGDTNHQMGRIVPRNAQHIAENHSSHSSLASLPSFPSLPGSLEASPCHSPPSPTHYGPDKGRRRPSTAVAKILLADGNRFCMFSEAGLR